MAASEVFAEHGPGNHQSHQSDSPELHPLAAAGAFGADLDDQGQEHHGQDLGLGGVHVGAQSGTGHAEPRYLPAVDGSAGSVRPSPLMGRMDEDATPLARFVTGRRSRRDVARSQLSRVAWVAVLVLGAVAALAVCIAVPPLALPMAAGVVTFVVRVLRK